MNTAEQCAAYARVIMERDQQIKALRWALLECKTDEGARSFQSFTLARRRLQQITDIADRALKAIADDMRNMEGN
jgi:hypothetical protein